jgi:hypothetical protein
MKKTIIAITFILIAINFQLSANNMTNEAFLKHFKDAQAQLIKKYEAIPKANFGTIEVKYYTGKDVKTADKMFLELLKHPKGDMFWMYPCISAYMLGKDKMSDEVKKAVRNVWKTYAPSRGDTENHWAMYYTSLLIASEQWPNLPGSEWYDGKSSTENFNEAKEYLLSWAKLTTSIGQGEFDSPGYICEYFNAISMMSEFVQDKEIKQLGKMLANYFLADFAVDALGQQYCGGHSRVYEDEVMNFQKAPSSSLAYFYFGSGKPIYSGWLLPAALTSYRTPEIIRAIATDREKPYVEKEKKRVRNVIRYGSEINPPVYKYMYMSKDYALGSLQGGLLQPIQQLTWSVRFNYGKPTSMIFGLNPYWSTKEIAMFFPRVMKICMPEIVGSKVSYDKVNKWTGGSPYERTFQNQNTLIALYNIKPGTNYEQIDGFFPANLEKIVRDKSGWIICKAGDTYVGWYPLQPYKWLKEYNAKVQNKYTTTGTLDKTKGTTLRNYRLRSCYPQNGYVVEVRSKDQVGSFEKFSDMLRSHIPTATMKPENVSVVYKTLDGTNMSFKYPDSRTLNGQKVDYSKFKLFEGPYLNADVNSENLNITHKDKKMVLDFKNLTITDK